MNDAPKADILPVDDLLADLDWGKRRRDRGEDADLWRNLR